MKITAYVYSLLLLTCFLPTAHADVGTVSQPPTVYIIPGNDGNNDGNKRLAFHNAGLAIFKESAHPYQSGHYDSNNQFIDYRNMSGDWGGETCLKTFKQFLGERQFAEQSILIGLSEGGATALGICAGKLPMETNESVDLSNIKAVLLDSPLVSGNAAAYHICNNITGLVHVIPYAYAMVPYLAQAIGAVGQTYNPAALQPIEVPLLINKDVPIIIGHAEDDATIPIYCSRALYAKLRKEGHRNVYLIETKGNQHCGILKKNKKIVQKILAYHLGFSNELDICLHKYQPDIALYETDLALLLRREKNLRRFVRKAY